MKYKVGDKVRVRSKEWYDRTKSRYGDIECGNFMFYPKMSHWCGEIITIAIAFDTFYKIKEDNGIFKWTDEMIEGLVEEECPQDFIEKYCISCGTQRCDRTKEYLNGCPYYNAYRCKNQNNVMEEKTKPEPKFKVGDKIKLKSTLLNDIFGVIGYEPEGYRITNISNGLTYFMSYSIEHCYELVEEEAKPKFKIGYKVKWHNHTCNITSIDTYENTYIYLIKYDDYKEDATFAKWVPESELTFEDDVETKPKYEDEVTGEYYSTPKYLVRPNGYQFVDENGNVIDAMKIVLEKKKKEYPKTYEECCDIVKVGKEHTLEGTTIRINYKIALLESFQKLLICRDAYWKIAGEEIGLGKPWSPDLTDNVNKHCIEFRDCGVCKVTYSYTSRIFAFPTEEMRDAFYENFKELIEQCKELL